MSDDINKIDRTAFDTIRVRPDQDQNGNLQRRKPPAPQDRKSEETAESDNSEFSLEDCQGGIKRLLDIKV